MRNVDYSSIEITVDGRLECKKWRVIPLSRESHFFSSSFSGFSGSSVFQSG